MMVSIWVLIMVVFNGDQLVDEFLVTIENHHTCKRAPHVLKSFVFEGNSVATLRSKADCISVG